jgi:hypothetical protein
LPLRRPGIIDSQSPSPAALARIFQCWFVNAPCTDKILLAPQPFRAAVQTSADRRVMVVFHQQIKVSILVNR